MRVDRHAPWIISSYDYRSAPSVAFPVLFSNNWVQSSFPFHSGSISSLLLSEKYHPILSCSEEVKPKSKKKKKLIVVSPSSQLPCNRTVYSGDATPGWKCLCRIASLKGHFHCLAPHSVVDYSHECGGDPRIRTGHA